MGMGGSRGNGVNQVNSVGIGMGESRVSWFVFRRYSVNE